MQPVQQPQNRNGLEELKKYLENGRALEAQLQQEKLELQNLLTQGRNAEAEALKLRMAQKFMMLQKFKMGLLALQQRQRAASAQNAQGGGQPPPPLSSGQSQPGPSAGPSSDPNAQAQLQQLRLLQQARSQTQQLNANSNTGATPGMNLPNNIQFNPSLAAQMQKLQMKEGIQGLQGQTPSGLPQQPPLQPPVFGGLPAAGPFQMNAQQQLPVPAQSQKSSWMGTFVFKAPQPAEVHVMLTCTNQNLSAPFFICFWSLFTGIILTGAQSSGHRISN